MNKIIIDKLTLLCDFYKKDTKLKFKYNAIQKALSYIKQYEYPITSGSFAKKNIQYIGDGISKRIDEILNTGTLDELKIFESIKSIDDKNNIYLNQLNDLIRITGMGEIRAKKLISQGITSIEKIREEVKNGNLKLTHHILLGIKYLEDFELKIPNEEIKEIEKILRYELNNLNKNLIMEICGSYRRGNMICGDIDILITNIDKKDEKYYMTEYVDILIKKMY